MSALPPKADIGSACRNVRFVPKADIAPLLHRSLVSVIGGPAAAPAAVLARQFMTHNDLLSGAGDGAALEEAQLLLYPFGGSQERIERGSQSPCATSKSASAARESAR
jgi:hypothetical protein